MIWRIIWAPAARDDIIGIRAYIDEFNPAAAARMARLLVDTAESLKRFPERGRPIGGDRREIVSVWPYVIRYRVSAGIVIILRVRHGMRRPD